MPLVRMCEGLSDARRSSPRHSSSHDRRPTTLHNNGLPWRVPRLGPEQSVEILCGSWLHSIPQVDEPLPYPLGPYSDNGASKLNMVTCIFQEPAASGL